VEEKVSCADQPLWYKQMFKVDESKRVAMQKAAITLIKQSKPEAYEFISKFKCKLVGFMPNVVYTMPDDSKGALQVNFVHKFSQYTLVYWCEQGGFAFFINASLKFDDEMGFTY
jgi:hypothetical protein